MATNHGDTFRTNGYKLYSYNALIGITLPDNSKVLFEYTSQGGFFLSMTTSTKHISPARNVATMVVTPEIKESLMRVHNIK
jgi:hypothetical protein